MNHYVQRICVRVMCKPQLAPLALQMNPEPCIEQVLCPQTTRDNALVAELADKVVFLDANKNLFLKQKENCKHVILFLPFFMLQTLICVCC